MYSVDVGAIISADSSNQCSIYNHIIPSEFVY